MRRTTVIVLHGYQGHPDTGWKPWLEAKLLHTGVETIIPRLPRPDQPKLAEWVGTLAALVAASPGDVILVGHSLGGTTILRYLETPRPLPIQGVVLLATPIEPRPQPNLAPLQEFFARPFNFEAIKHNARRFVVINSSNDTLVTPQEGATLRDKLGARYLELKERGHFSSYDGITEIGELFDAIKSVM